ncbi:hypothetical protein [Chryseobacterium scophthalmum]|nr:hypothetical protein [Chryseobacterium scophthalmum]
MNEEEKDELLKLFLSYQERIFINVRKHPEYDINKIITIYLMKMVRLH